MARQDPTATGRNGTPALGTVRSVSEAATTAKFPRRHGRRKRVGPQSLPPPPGGTIVPEAVPALDDDEIEEELAITSRLSRPDVEWAVAQAAGAADASDDASEVGSEPGDAEAVPNLSELAAYAGPDSFRKDRKYQRASTTPLPHRLARMQGEAGEAGESGESDEDGADAAAQDESSDVASRVDGGARDERDRAVPADETGEPSRASRMSSPGAAGAAGVDDAGSVGSAVAARAERSERRPASGPTGVAADAAAREVARDAARSERDAAPIAVARPASQRYFLLLLAITCLAVGLVLGALLFARRGTSAGAGCPDPSAHEKAAPDEAAHGKAAHGKAAHSMSASPRSR